MNFTLCLTHACNMRCDYCYAGDKHGGSMTWETAQRAVDFSLEQVMQQARSHGRHPVTQLGFFGGEPLLQWELLTRATDYTEDECAKLGILLKKTVTTNMSLLDFGRADWLIGHGFEVGLSLDGTAQRHDRLRRMADGSESHARCADALRHFHGAPDRCVVILVIDPLNVSGLADSIAWLVDQGMTGFILNPNYYANWPADGLARWSGEMEMVANHLVRWYREGKTIRIDVLDSKIDARIQGVPSRCGECGYGGGEIAIASSGSIYPCVRSVGADDDLEMCIGNVFEGFDHSRRARLLAPAMRRIVNRECHTCNARDRCENWCACVNLGTTGDINRVSGLVCFHEKMAIATADRLAAELFAERVPAFMRRFYDTRHLG